MGGKRVLMVGLHPDVVDYADPAYAAFPGFNADKLATLLEQDPARLCTEGFDAIWSFWEKKPTSEQTFLDALASHRPDAVLIGAGVRFNPALTELFETLVNLVATHAPGCRLCFNSGPHDSAAAVKRQVS